MHIRPSLSTDYLLRYLSQEEIIYHFIKVSPVYGRNILSPIRTDKHPTFGFKWIGDRIIMNDFRGSFKGDCFVLVKYIYRCSYSTALEIIYDEMLAGKTVTRPPMETLEIVERENKTIQIKSREWNKEDLAYWEQYGVNKQLLDKYYVKPCQNVFLDGETIYYSKYTDPAYSYYFGKGEYKIYFPKRDRSRFVCNTKAIQGYWQLPSTDDYLILTKALKDCMSLNRLGYSAIAPQSEGAYYEEDFISEMKSRFENIVIFYDNDNTGIEMAKRESEKHGFPYVYIDEEKDISDYIKRFGLQQADALMNSLL